MNFQDGLARATEVGGIFRRFAGSSAFAQAVILPALLFLFLSRATGEILGGGGDSATFLAVLALSVLVSWTLFTAAGMLIDALAPEPSWPRTIAVTTVYALTEVAGVETLNALTDPPDLGAGYRIVAAMAVGLIFFGLASTVVGDYRAYRYSYRAYSERSFRLRVAFDETQAHVQLVRAQFATWVQRLLTYNVSNAFKLTTPAEPRHLEIANELFRISDEIVRPLSHGFAAKVPPSPDVPLAARPRRIPFASWSKDVVFAAPFQPVAATVLVAVATAPNLLLGRPLVSAALWVAFLGLVFISAAVGHRALVLLRKLHPAAAFAATTVVLAAPHSLYAGAYLRFALEVPTVSIIFFLYAGVLGGFISWLPGVAEGFQQSRRRTLSALESVDDQLAWWQVRAQSQLWLDQRRLALALHSDVQSTILSAAMRLKNAVEAGPAESKKVLPSVERTIKKSLQLSFEDSKLSTLRSVVTSINKTWASLITLKLDAPKDVGAAVGEDSLALEVLIEAIKELHMNSFKHGRATECVITLLFASEHSLRVVMRNNGSPLAADPGAGLGGTFFETVCLSRSAKNIPGGVEIVLEIPLERTENAETG